MAWPVAGRRREFTLPKPNLPRRREPTPLVGVEWVRQALFGGRVSRHTLYRRVREGRIPAVRVGRRLYFDPDGLRAWVRAGGGRSL